MQRRNVAIGQRFSYAQSSLLFSDLPFLENQQKIPENNTPAQHLEHQNNQRQTSEQNNKRKREEDADGKQHLAAEPHIFIKFLFVYCVVMA